MGSKIKRVWRLRSNHYELDYLEIGFAEGTYLRLKLAPSPKEGNSKHSIYINHHCEIIEHLPGKRLRNMDFEKCASEGKHLCGYLREPHLYTENHSGVEKFAGLCALCEFEQCKFPRALDSSHKNNCPVLLEYEKKAIEIEMHRKND
jgi:hypothetical protein